MTIAELFVKLGVTGAEGAERSLRKTSDGMKGLFDSSLAAKAAVAGVIYGLERLTGFASQAGMDLNKFQMTTGLSTDKLQEWQRAGEIYDVTGQEMSQTISGLQQTMADMMLGKGMPEGAAALGIKMTRDPYTMMQQLVEKAKSLPPDVGRNLIKSFGISDNVFQMMRSVNFERDKMSKKDIITSKEIASLTEVNKLWKDFWFTLRTFGTKAVAAGGVGVIKEVVATLKLLLNGAAYIADLIRKFDSLKAVALAVAAAIAIAFFPATAAVVAIAAALADLEKWREGKKSVIGSIQESLKGVDVVGSLKDTMTSGKGLPMAAESKPGDKLLPSWEEFKSAFSAGIAPAMAPAAAGGGAQINNTFHIDGSGDPEQTASLVEKHITKQFSNAARQSSAQAGGY